MTRILVRADAGVATGRGHVVRQQVLARLLRDRGSTVTFACRPGRGDAIAGLRDAGHPVVVLPATPVPLRRAPWPDEVQRLDAAAVVTAGGASGWDVVVVDHYRLDARWERAVRAATDRVVAVDDLDDRTRDVDLLVDHNYYGPGTVHHHHEVPRRLLGPRYALLDPAYARARARRGPARRPASRVLVGFGGTDPHGATVRVLRALSDPSLVHLDVDIVVGSPDRVGDELRAGIEARPRTTLHVAVPGLAGLLARADLAVGASGAGTWERLCLGVPALVATSSPSQSGATKALAAEGATTWVGLAADVDVVAWRNHLRRAVGGGVPHPPQVVDGRGAERVAAAMLPAISPSVVLRPLTSADAPLFAGRDVGDPAAGARLLDGASAWRTGEQELLRRLDDASDASRVVLVDGIPQGVVRREQPGAAPDVTLFDAARTPAVEAAVRRVLH